MPRRLTSQVDYQLVLAALAPEDRDTVERWTSMLGAQPGTWHRVPPMRDLATMLAVLRLAATMTELAPGDAFRNAAELVGLEDDSGRATAPADSLARTLRNWTRPAETDFQPRAARNHEICARDLSA